MAITFTKFSGGIKIFDTKDDSVVSLIDPIPARITAFRSTNNVEIITNGFSKLFSANEVVAVIVDVTPVGLPSHKAEDIADILRDLIFYEVFAPSTTEGDTTLTPPASVIISMEAGDNFAPGQVVAIEPDGLAHIYNIYENSNSGSIAGIALQSVLIGQNIEICVSGIALVPDAGWTPGAQYYIGPNGIPQIYIPNSPQISKLIGVGVTADELLLNTAPEVIRS